MHHNHRMSFKRKTVEIYIDTVQILELGIWGNLVFEEEVEAAAMSQVLYMSILGFHLGLPQAVSTVIIDTHKLGHSFFTKGEADWLLPLWCHH